MKFSDVKEKELQNQIWLNNNKLLANLGHLIVQSLITAIKQKFRKIKKLCLKYMVLLIPKKFGYVLT